MALITSPSVSKTTQYQSLSATFGDRAVLRYDEVLPHPPAERLVDLISKARDSGASTFIGVGGGSSIDSAKFASLGVAEDIYTVDELTDFGVHFEYPDKEWVRPLKGRPGPIVAVPTTLSAAEWDGFAGTVDTRINTKFVARYLELTPKIVALDPEFSATTPRQIWATTGIRAVDHAIEISYALNATPLTSALSYGALELLASNLSSSVNDASNHAAAAACQWAAMMSILGVHNVSLGLSHAIGHQLGAYGVPHGVTSCVMLPHVMKFLLPATQNQQGHIARAFGKGYHPNLAASAIQELLEELNVPTRLRDVTLPRDAFPSIARATIQDIVVRESPMPVTEESIIDILERAW